MCDRVSVTYSPSLLSFRPVSLQNNGVVKEKSYFTLHHGKF